MVLFIKSDSSEFDALSRAEGYLDSRGFKVSRESGKSNDELRVLVPDGKNVSRSYDLDYGLFEADVGVEYSSRFVTVDYDEAGDEFVVTALELGQDSREHADRIRKELEVLDVDRDISGEIYRHLID